VTSNPEDPRPSGLRRIVVDFETQTVTLTDATGSTSHALSSPLAFEAVSRAWLRAGWEVKHPYTFSWFDRPVIQLPEDLVRAQEAIVQVRPDVIVECGIAHGGSLVFFATLCQALGRGRVVGVDIEIRPHNRRALEQHPLSPLITLVEGDSIDPAIVSRVASSVRADDRVMVFLDSKHTKDHVLAELEAYSGFVTEGSYIVVADGIMEEFAGSPRAGSDWSWNTPRAAVHEFLARRTDFVLAPPAWPFNESIGLAPPAATYWVDGWLRRRTAGGGG
jgi:cephalosporin hydroxylase